MKQLERERSAPVIPVSWGELIDKITILEIKSVRLEQAAALANVRRELDALRDRAGDALALAPIVDLKAQLAEVNLSLWEIEDAIRLREAAKDFGERFVELARSVYRTNDRRAQIKRQINETLASSLIEEKSYSDYS